MAKELGSKTPPTQEELDYFNTYKMAPNPAVPAPRPPTPRDPAPPVKAPLYVSKGR